VQEKGRFRNPARLPFRVGQITHDSHVPAGQVEQRLDETEIGDGTTITFIDAKLPAALGAPAAASNRAL